jgi:hypothetical protein
VFSGKIDEEDVLIVAAMPAEEPMPEDMKKRKSEQALGLKMPYWNMNRAESQKLNLQMIERFNTSPFAVKVKSVAELDGEDD